MGTISKDFSYREFEITNKEQYKDKNIITDYNVRNNIKALVENVLQPLRDEWGKPLIINSGYRCPELNSLIGGKPTSQHLRGEAADIRCDNSFELAKKIIELKLPYDQIGLYNTFVHISHKKNGDNRKMIFYDNRYNGERF
ncbi:MAG: D-Ala-D-Ala carboxypeptidase family metallohydrolase [Alphaproteobacteria bacterium]